MTAKICDETEETVELMVLSVPDCPNVALLDQRLTAALAGRAGVRLLHRQIKDAEQAAVAGLTGSPTLLVDGVDPFAEPGRVASVSCRLYRDEQGRPARAPSLTQLRAALAPRDAADQ